MTAADKLAEALRLAREWFRHEAAGEGPQADDVIKAADEAIAAHDAEQAAKAVPAGFVLVPVEPTPKMIERGRWDEFGEDCTRAYPVPDYYVTDVWAAMLEAAPTPPAPEAPEAPEAQQALASDWSWTTVRMELEASGRDDLSAWVASQLSTQAQQAAGQELASLPPIDDYLPTDGPRWTTANFIACVERYATDYARAALAQHREPLTDEQIAEGRYRTWAAEPEDAPEAWSFFRGARWAESALAVRWGVKLGATTGEQHG